MLKKIDWKKVAGLLPTIIQSSVNQSVLMLGYMNSEALRLTKKSGMVHFYSRTKQRVWKKGEKSGNILEVASMHLDCDGDAMLIIATPKNCICHKGYYSCFGTEKVSTNWLFLLEKIVGERMQHGKKSSYVKSLTDKGIINVAQKVAEEGVEVAIASTQKDKTAVVEETADLLFHLLVNLKIHKLNFSQVISCLQKRHINKIRGSYGSNNM